MFIDTLYVYKCLISYRGNLYLSGWKGSSKLCWLYWGLFRQLNGPITYNLGLFLAMLYIFSFGPSLFSILCYPFGTSNPRYASIAATCSKEQTYWKSRPPAQEVFGFRRRISQVFLHTGHKRPTWLTFGSKRQPSFFCFTKIGPSVFRDGLRCFSKGQLFFFGRFDRLIKRFP